MTRDTIHTPTVKIPTGWLNALPLLVFALVDLEAMGGFVRGF